MLQWNSNTGDEHASEPAYNISCDANGLLCGGPRDVTQLIRAAPAPWKGAAFGLISPMPLIASCAALISTSWEINAPSPSPSTTTTRHRSDTPDGKMLLNWRDCMPDHCCVILNSIRITVRQYRGRNITVQHRRCYNVASLVSNKYFKKYILSDEGMTHDHKWITWSKSIK